jgi:hypothetical protein
MEISILTKASKNYNETKPLWINDKWIKMKFIFMRIKGTRE